MTLRKSKSLPTLYQDFCIATKPKIRNSSANFFVLAEFSLILQWWEIFQSYHKSSCWFRLPPNKITSKFGRFQRSPPVTRLCNPANKLTDKRRVWRNRLSADNWNKRRMDTELATSANN